MGKAMAAARKRRKAPKVWREVKDHGTINYVIKSSRTTKQHQFASLKSAVEWARENGLEDDVDIQYFGKEVLIEVSEVKNDGEKVSLPSGVYELSAADDDIYYRPNESLTPFDMRTDATKFEHDSYPDLSHDVQLFLSKRDLYEELDAMFKRGYVLYGPPGTGKTTMVRKLVQNLVKQNDAVVIFCDEVPRSATLRALREDSRLKIFIFEELTTTLSNPMAVKSVLEFLDGERSVPNSITIATTNYPKELPDNVINRKGRFDVVMEVKGLGKEKCLAFAESILKRPLETEEAKILGNLTIAEIKDVCVKHLIYGTKLVDYKSSALKRPIGLGYLGGER